MQIPFFAYVQLFKLQKVLEEESSDISIFELRCNER